MYDDIESKASQRGFSDFRVRYQDISSDQLDKLEHVKVTELEYITGGKGWENYSVDENEVDNFDPDDLRP